MFKKRTREPIPMQENFSPSFEDILNKLLDPNDKKRLGAKGANEIKQHGFFSDINWEDVYNKKCTPPIIPIIEDDEVKYFEKVIKFLSYI